MKMKRFWLLLLCVLAATALMQCAKEPTPESPTTQTGEDKATGEESKKDAGIASRTVLAVPLSEEEMKYMKIFYYIPEGENQAPILAVVTLNTMDQSFTLEHDPSSYSKAAKSALNIHAVPLSFFSLGSKSDSIFLI